MNYYNNVNGQQILTGRCKGITHRVRRGDSLYKLSRIYGVSVSAIIDANSELNVYNLQVGDKVCIPLFGGNGNNNGNELDPDFGRDPIEVDPGFTFPGNPGGGNGGGNVINGFMYRVTPNDTLNSILEQFGITFEQFAAYNPQLMPITIEEGTTVYLPPENIAR